MGRLKCLLTDSPRPIETCFLATTCAPQTQNSEPNTKQRHQTGLRHTGESQPPLIQFSGPATRNIRNEKSPVSTGRHSIEYTQICRSLITVEDNCRIHIASIRCPEPREWRIQRRRGIAKKSHPVVMNVPVWRIVIQGDTQSRIGRAKRFALRPSRSIQQNRKIIPLP